MAKKEMEHRIIALEQKIEALFSLDVIKQSILRHELEALNNNKKYKKKIRKEIIDPISKMFKDCGIQVKMITMDKDGVIDRTSVPKHRTKPG